MKTLIIGGGLSGLALADMLERAGQDYLLIEARTRFGGRIKAAHHDTAAFDLGPAWFWQGQPRIAALLARLGLSSFEQYAQGTLTFEDEHGQVQRGRGFASMEGSLRVAGGLSAVTDALANRLPKTRARLGAQVTRLDRSGDTVTAILANSEQITADRVVLALPPRVAETLTITPALLDRTIETLRGIPTWMAGQAKAIAIYDKPFWREAGLSGDAMSRKGPMVEIHDASPETGGPYALFGFIGVPPSARADQDVLRAHLRAQLGRLFGPAGADPVALHIQDWAFEPHTSTQADHAPLYAHPTYGLPRPLDGLWDGRLLFAGTEVARTFGGYVEGALEAAEQVFPKLRD